MRQSLTHHPVCQRFLSALVAFAVLMTILLGACLPLPLTIYAVELSPYSPSSHSAANTIPNPPSRLSVAVTQLYDRDHWNVVGSIQTHQVRGRESLLEIARNYGLGYNEIARANPNLDPFSPGAGAKVLIPTARVLPLAPFDQGIVLNLGEKRLYFFHQRNGERLVSSFPVAIGAVNTDTPLGDFIITTKLTNPSWTVPLAIRERRPYLPAIVPPGPENPLGSHALRLSHGGYFIHGTNRPWSIGRRVTYGCVRMYPEDILVFFAMVPPGTPVRVIHQPIKIGWREGIVYIEVHHDGIDDYDEKQWQNHLIEAEMILQKKGLRENVDALKLAEALRRGLGVATPIGRMPTKR